MYNIYSIVILILFDILRFSVNDLHQIQVAAPSPSSRNSSILWHLNNTLCSAIRNLYCVITVGGLCCCREYLMAESLDKKKEPYDMTGWKLFNVKVRLTAPDAERLKVQSLIALL